jgi:hypothetical protein
MRSLLSGPLATLLMFVPLVAVPLLAVFGMPQFSTLSPAAQADDLKFAVDRDKVDRDKSSPNPPQQEGDLLGGVQITDPASAADAPKSAASRARNDSDPFAEFTRTADGDSHQAAAPAGNRTFPPARRAQHWPIDEGKSLPQKSLLAFGDAGSDKGGATPTSQDRSSAEVADANSGEHTKSKADTKLTAGFDSTRERLDGDHLAGAAAGSPSGEARSWKAAVARLNALGIRDYQLQPGDRAGEFHFSCRLVSRTNPRVMQRFEAEAAEPLDAVERVLEQIDEWKARRASASVHTSSRESQSKVTAIDPPDETVPVSANDVFNR